MSHKKPKPLTLYQQLMREPMPDQVMHALYFRVSSDSQTTENQFQDVLELAAKEDPSRDWNGIRALLRSSVYEEARTTSRRTYTLYRVDEKKAIALAQSCVYLEQGKSGARNSNTRPMFERMIFNAGRLRFQKILVWKVTRLGRDMREVLAAVYELADLGITVIPIKSQTGPISSSMGRLLWAIQAWYAEMENDERSSTIRAGLERARAAGKKVGRPRSSLDLSTMARIHAETGSARAVAKQMGLPLTTVRRALKGVRQNVAPPPAV
jgi:putative DNA-invertase from lambdoid prophage Rac